MKYHLSTVLMRMSSVIIFFLIVLSLGGCSCNREPVSETGFYFDTVITVTIYNPADAALLDECFELADTYENMLSKTVNGSDIWNINHADGKPVAVQEETAYLLDAAVSYARLTDGKIDPTISKVSALWNFQDASHSGIQAVIPSAQSLKEALSHVDYRCIRINGNTVTLTDSHAELDLGFIAKGYIADRMKSLLQSRGVKSALINLGGNVLALGNRPDGGPFQIGIQKPFAPEGTAATVLSASDNSVVSSGVYERYFEKDGKIYHHILDTKTGYPVRNNLSSVTILSKSSMEGDALSTACFVLGPDEGMALVEALPDTEAVFITDDGALHASEGLSLR